MEQKRTRIMLSLLPDEWDALRTTSIQECRDPRKQIQYLIRTTLLPNATLFVNSNSDTTRQGQSVAVAPTI